MTAESAAPPPGNRSVAQPDLLRSASALIAHPAIRLIVSFVLVGLAVYILHTLASHVRWSEVKADLAAAPIHAILAAIGSTAVSFFAISVYDLLATRSVAPGKVPVHIAGFAGATGYAISNLLGFSYLTGTAVRYRIYSSIGLDLNLVAGVIATAWVAFWTGLVLLLGGLMILHPFDMGAIISLGDGTETVVGVLLLLSLGAFFAWLAAGRRRFALTGFAFDLPSLGISLLLCTAAVLDIGGAAMTLYVLLPGDLAASFAYVFVVYIAAVAAGILSHAPGGLGVFEATILLGLGAAARPDVLAALLLYRLIYTVLPFALAALSLGTVWVRTQRKAAYEVASLSYRLAESVIPLLAAGISLVAGTVLLVSGNLPADTARLGLLRELLPLPFVETSHLVGSIAGVLLIVVSHGLYRKLFRAWAVAMLLLLVGLVASLVKGLDWEEALSLAVTCAVLGLFRSAFYRVDGTSVFQLNGAWFVSTAALVAAIFWVGLFAYSHVDYRNELWWQFAWHGDASRFLRAAMVSSVVLAAISLNSLITSRARPAEARPIPARVRELLAGCDDPEAQIALTGDKDFLLSDDGDAFLAFADTGRTLIAKGDPVGTAEAGRSLIWKLRERADRAALGCGFYAVSGAYLPTYLDLGLSVLKIGEVAHVDLGAFSLNGPSKKDLRYARNRAVREGVEFAIIPRAELAATLPELRRISDAWLEAKQGQEKHFSLGAFAEGYLENFDHAVLRRSGSGDIVAFANLLRGANRHELSVDLMRYLPTGPNYAMDALFAELMLWGQAEGFHWFSLGAAPLAGIESRRYASLWNRIGGFLYEHGEQFYRFEGLRAFKQKFDPVWSPSYLASPRGIAAARVLYEVNVLISGGIKGLLK